MKIRLLLFMLPFMLLSCGASRQLGTITEVSNHDTTSVSKVKIMEYSALSPFNLEVGQSIDLPALNIKVTRISKGEAVVEQQTEIITQKETTIKLISTKTIDRSKDKSVKDSNVKSKVKDKAKSKAKKSENTKTKDNHKQVKRGFPWLFLIIGLLLLIGGKWAFNQFLKT